MVCRVMATDGSVNEWVRKWLKSRKRNVIVIVIIVIIGDAYSMGFYTLLMILNKQAEFICLIIYLISVYYRWS